MPLLPALEHFPSLVRDSYVYIVSKRFHTVAQHKKSDWIVASTMLFQPCSIVEDAVNDGPCYKALASWLPGKATVYM